MLLLPLLLLLLPLLLLLLLPPSLPPPTCHASNGPQYRLLITFTMKCVDLRYSSFSCNLQ